MKKGTVILYRGEQYKIKQSKIRKIGNSEIEYVEIPHKKYTIWVNAAYVEEIIK